MDLVPDALTGTDESPYHPADVELVAGVVDALRLLKRLGFVLVVASNQPAAAKGRRSLADLEAVHRRTVELLYVGGVALDGWRYCFHHPAGVVESLSGECACRKPKPGLLLGAAAELEIDLARSWMVGDASTDVEAGHQVGCATILIDHPGSAHRRPPSGRRPDYTALDLLAASCLISAEVAKT